MKITPGIAELVGVLIGDGYIYRKNRKYQIGIVGNPINDKEYFEKLKELIFKEWNKKVNAKYRFRGLRMVFDSREICNFLIDDLELCHGKGKCFKVTIPEEIYKNWNLTKHTLRGIVDTDGSIFVSRKPGIDKYPSIEVTTTSHNLAIQIKEILIKNRFNVTLREEKWKKIIGLKSYRISLYGQKNLKKWIEEIGFTNPYKLNRALSYLKNRL